MRPAHTGPPARIRRLVWKCQNVTWTKEFNEYLPKCRRGGQPGQGHHVQLNGSTSVPLSQCKVTGVHGLNDSNLDESGNKIDPDLHSTVYVDVVCHNP
jgi:hypothetical protein